MGSKDATYCNRDYSEDFLCLTSLVQAMRQLSRLLALLCFSEIQTNKSRTNLSRKLLSSMRVSDK